MAGRVYNRMTKFEWDAHKAKSNIRKHGVSFEEAETAFLQTNFRRQLLIRIIRSLKIGLSRSVFQPEKTTGCLLHAIARMSIRIISARRLTKREREIYEEH